MSSAFKEWHLIVEALIAGEQLLILRKGGISEGRGGFAPDRAARFWLFPTWFHAQLEKTKAAAARFADSAHASNSSDASIVTLRAFADVVHHAFLSDWEAVARLDAFHLWSPETVRERFDWSKPPGIHVFIVRVHRLASPISLPLTPEMGGCRSWIELPLTFDDRSATPVVDEPTFRERVNAIGL